MSKNKKLRQSVRFVALDALERVAKGGAYSNLLINDLINEGKLNELDGRLLTELVYGTISRQLLLDYYLQPSIQQAKKIDPWVRLLLRLSLYQMLYLDKVPNHAIFNEAVEIAKVRGNIGIGKFVNGVLRNIQRNGVPATAEIKDPIERLATEISMPRWLTEKFIAQIGLEETRNLGQSLFEHSHVSARVDTRTITREQAMETLLDEGIEAQASQISPYGIVAEKGFLAGSGLFSYGLLTVQDESSMLVAPTLQVESHHQVLDACAAPGGKTTHIASFLDQASGGQVTALDIHQKKVKLIQENAKRLHVDNVVTAKALDARTVNEVFETGQFDRILVDAPCSGLGLMRRKPDIKYNKQATDFERLPKIQLEILNSAAVTLKQGGIMVYSTCTVAYEENQQVVTKFLAQHPEFELIEPLVNETVATLINEKMLTIYPQQFHTDGFFISCLRKKD
ncbi:MAG: 16S rRNA (cytosine(967)-C(5))-methyltransferase RsmB [Enterococcus sp.]